MGPPPRIDPTTHRTMSTMELHLTFAAQEILSCRTSVVCAWQLKVEGL